MWYWHSTREQWKKLKRSKADPHKYRYFMYDRGGIENQQEKEYFSINGAGISGMHKEGLTWTNNKQMSTLSELNMNVKGKKCKADDIREYFYDIRVGKVFFKHYQKTLNIKD